MKLLKHIVDLVTIFITFLISSVLKLNRKYTDIWLVSERRNEAEDNGYHIFRYIRENYPEQKVYYVIEKRSNSYNRLKKYGNVIQHNSFHHFLYYFLADKHLSAFQFFGVPETPILWFLEKRGFIRKKKVFLQHGITKEKLPFLEYKNTKYSLFVCGAQPEYEYVSKEYGYPKENVKYLGFCRFDNLHGIKRENTIILMPTWRQWFGLTNINNQWENDMRKFEESEYYERYTHLINNPSLHNVLKKHNTKLIFYPHPEMQRFLKAFQTNSDYIEIANRDKYNLQELIRDSKLLITDYSSIAFDFAYMRKPLIYYQFDQEKYYSHHFKKGYFDCEANGFGPVIKEEVGLIGNISTYLTKEENEEKYVKRAMDFFPIYDQDNCKRTYEAVKAM